MSKNFSVEWLSQSYHAQQMDQEDSNTTCRIPRLPDSVSKASPNIFRLFGEGEKIPSSPANSCGYTSTSESDVGDDSEGESGPHRRVRTKFTSEQITRLEKTFNKHKYLGASQRRKIAEKLHLSETQVKTWFQNRRMKLKREVQDMRAAHYFVPTLLPPVTSFQHHTMSGQRPLHMFIHQHAQQSLSPVHHQPAHPMIFSPCYF
ncbi:Homeobox protein vent1 [Triplophysa tibetana]|uniref:Homeobox protein vent1 n=1 Tax=Triplophysa tibetana TaxID=1572043 RepID=A0A5A9P8W5_9TELE|nr:Homeobox protein vent1 [Triplophysa tibetana]